MKLNYKNILTFFFIAFFQFSYSQKEVLKIKDINLSNQVLLFKEYKKIGKNCKSERGEDKFCKKEERLFENNIDELSKELEYALTYLNIKSELVKEEELEKEIYKDKTYYRYVFENEPIISRGGNSCFSNPGALLIDFSLWDRLEDKRYELGLDYTFFICDIQVLINEINSNLKNATTN